MLKDRYGNPVSTASQAALAKFDAACEQLRLYRGDPIATLDEALEADPDFTMAWAMRAGILVQQTDAAFADEIERSLRAAASSRGSERERAHIEAARDWSQGRMEAAVTGFARIVREHPRDVVALQAAHVGAFFLGRQADLRDGPAQALRAFAPGDDGRHAVLGMAAFGYEECGDFARAQALGEEAVDLEPRDGWAVHAVAHVHEMRGDTDAGVPWLRDNADSWAPESGFAFHNWWHLALLHMDRGDYAEALRLYDEKVRPSEATQVILEWIDASALLWRLRLEGVDVSERFERVAESWSRAAEDGIYAFNDVHAVIAFIGAGRHGDVARTIAAMRKAALGSGDNAYMTRAVGLPIAEALCAFEAGDDATCVDKLADVRGVAQRFGGSHAQRDILTLTALHAALRGQMKEAAAAFAAERLAAKPQSPWARRLAARAHAIGARQAA